MKYILTLLFCVGFLSAQSQSMNLSGQWQFALDSLNKGEAEEWFNNELPLQIKLPGTTDEAKFGEMHIPGTPLYNGDSEIWRLARKYRYIGLAWYQKTVELPEDWDGKNVSLFLERCMWQTKVWINGKYAGENHSLCAPHIFGISDFLMPGKNTISLCIDNSPYVHLGSWSHGYTPGIQTIWNGAVGNIQLIAKDKVFLNDVRIYPSFRNQTLTVKGKLISTEKKNAKGKVKFIISDKNNTEVIVSEDAFTLQNDTFSFQTAIELNNQIKPWDEFQPDLYSVEVKSEFGNSIDSEKIIFGLRDIETKDGRFVVNGNKIFMRGEHEAGSFPLTGYASMQKEEWLGIFKIGKEHGLNHWRFHSWCPPKAAFEAADEVGIYLQPELTLFSQDWEGTLVGTDKARDEFLFEELKRLLDTYGNHPSFVLMCMGNELRGDHKVLEKWVAWGKAYDSRHLYSGSANLEAMKLYEKLEGDDFQVAHAGRYNGKRVARRMFNYFSSEIPNTKKDYSHTLQAPYNQWPIISHEVGQWTVYPDFSEIENYKGVLASRNIEVFQSRLQQKGMLEQANDFLMASGKLSALLYREEMERLLRTPGMGGYQLLDLRDYQAQGSAMIGMLNAFWESKGFISADEFRQSNNAVTLLLKMPKRIWLNNETYNAELVVPNYGAAELSNLKIEWEVLADGIELFSGELKKAGVEQGEVVSIGDVSFDLNSIEKATKLVVHLAALELDIENNYDVWVYPATLPDENDSKIIVATEATSKLLKKIERGASVLLVPRNGYDKERTQFTTPFWSTILFNYQVKTMGVLCEPEHAVFSDFPTDYHSNWQWWDLTKDAYSVRLNQTEKGYEPLLQVIDHPERNDKLGAIVETRIGKGKLLVSTFDILSDLDERPVARQLKYSILNYMKSSEFNPVEVKGIKEAFFSGDDESKVEYNKITSSNEYSESPVIYAFDGDEKTYWQTLKSNESKISVEIELKQTRYITGCKFVSNSKNKPGNFKVYVSKDKDEMGNVIIFGNANSESSFEAENWDNGFTIQKGKNGKYIFIEMESENNEVIRLEELLWIFGD